MSGDIAKELCLWADDPMWADHAEVPKVFLHSAADALDAKDKLIAELEAALEPFAREADANPLQSDLAPFGEHVTYGDLRRARHVGRSSSPAGDANG